MNLQHPALASRMASAKPSPTAVVSDEARKLRSEGMHIVNMGEGELDFDTPSHVVDAAIEAMKTGQTKYTAVAGTAELKDAVNRKFKRENNLSYSSNEIIITSGAKQAIFNAFQATLNPGDEVIFSAPYWVSYPDMVSLAGGTPVAINCDASTAFKLTPEVLEAAITPKTKWFILNSPSNPTGALYSELELAALADVFRRHKHVMVMSDDIYEHIIYDGAFSSFASAAPDLLDRTLTVNGVSKCFSMTGWRIGYAGGPAWLIHAIGILQSQSTSNASSISQAAAIAALDSNIDFIADWKDRLRVRRDIVMSAISATDGILSANVPPSAFYVFANCSGALGKRGRDGSKIETDVDMAKYLLNAANTAVIPGIAFGMSPFLRIAYALDDEELKFACDNIVEACQCLQ